MSHLIYFVSWLGPGPRRVLPRFRLHNKRPSATRATTKATPPTVPPTIAPVLGELDSFLGATASPVADVDGDAWVLPGSESDLVSEVVEDPMVVGVVRAVAVPSERPSCGSSARRCVPTRWWRRWWPGWRHCRSRIESSHRQTCSCNRHSCRRRCRHKGRRPSAGHCSCRRSR